MAFGAPGELPYSSVDELPESGGGSDFAGSEEAGQSTQQPVDCGNFNRCAGCSKSVIEFFLVKRYRRIDHFVRCISPGFDE